MTKLITTNGNKRQINSYSFVNAKMLRDIVDDYNYEKEELLIFDMLRNSYISANDKFRNYNKTIGLKPNYDLKYVEKRLKELGFNVLIKDERTVIGKSIAQITIAW